MRVAQDGQSTLLFLAAQAQQPDGSCQLRITVIRVLSAYERAFTSEPDDIMEKVGDWLTEGATANCVGLHLDTRGELSIYRVSADSHLMFQPVQFLPHPPSPSASTLGPSGRLPGGEESTGFLPLPLSQSLNQIGQQFKLPNPFSKPSHRKSMSFRYSRYNTIPKSFGMAAIEEQNLDPSRVELGDEVDAGAIEWGLGTAGEQVVDISGLALATFANGTKVMGCAWSPDRVSVFRLDTRERKKVRALTAHEADGIQQVYWLNSDTYAMSTPEEVQVYALKITDANNDDVSGDAWFLDETLDVIHRAELAAPFPQEGETTSSCLISPSMLLVSRHDALKDSSDLSIVNLPVNSRPKPLSRKSTRRKDTQMMGGTRPLWSSGPRNIDPTRVHAVLPLGFDTVILGLGDGRIARATMEELFVQRHCPLPSGSSIKSDLGLDWPISSLERVKNNRTEEEYIVGGSFEGSIAIWSLSDLQLRARWTVFATPLLSVIDLGAEEEHAVDNMQLLYLIPGATSPLEKLCLGEDNLLLIYADASKARLWDLKTQEFWRSMTKAKAEELLEQDVWSTKVRDSPAKHASDTRRMLLEEMTQAIFIDIGELIRTGMTTITKKPSSATAATDLASPGILRAWMYLHPILSAFLTMQIADPDFDELCLGLLGSRPPGTVSACGVAGSTWSRSPEYSSGLLLAILSLLKAGSHFEEWDSITSQISTYLINNLYQIVGDSFKFPSLEALTSYWFSPCSEVKQSARTLFTSQVQRLSEKQACDIVEEGRYRLPAVQPDSLKDAPYSAAALVVVGHVAVEHYASIPAETLTDIAKSVALYLHDESSPHRTLAIELCSVGFHVWQHYVDAVNVLRALFELATNSGGGKKDATGATQSSTGGVGPQARSAVLQIASTNTPLFMTTLTMDIATPKSVDHRRSVMQLIAFIIKKKPLVLYPNLTRLVEAVIKSLDPNIASNREAVMDPAVEILGHVVRTFPTVDFHKATQRLALGTNEGAVIMYDLKTATRLYVLEGHKKRLTAVSFSPDGRRLVTVSLDESVVMVWKVGSSFTSFFNPGAPPRQGGTGTEAYKVYPFNVGDEARMTIAGTLDWVAFEWTNDRTARLKIRDSALTFATT
ncbi:hypothetical protein FRB90_001428 [Tulasnella sp. 427]|nr:hypothetical protein FRB90_001428 [Tulasnella sp. 427]